MNDYSDIASRVLSKVSKKRENLDKIRADNKLAIPYFLRSNEPPYNFVVNSKLHNEIQDFIRKHKLCVIVVPREHAKTEQIAIGSVLCEIGRNPNIRIKMFCEKEDGATDRVISIKRYIETSEEYRKLFPSIKPSAYDWKNKSITVDRPSFSKDSTLEAIGVFAASTGARADLIIGDDLCGESSLAYQEKRQAVKRIFRNTIMNLLSPDGRMIYIATPFHYDDLTMELIKNHKDMGFALFMRKIDEKLTPIWPEKWTKKALIARRKAIGHAAFSRGFHCEPLAEEDAIFDRNDLGKHIFSLSCSAQALTPEIIKEERVDRTWVKVMGVDPAISQSSRADYTVIFVVGIHPEKKYKVPLEIVRAKLSSVETAKTIIEMQHKWNCTGIRCENISYQRSLEEWIREVSKAPMPITNQGNKFAKKIFRARALSVEISSGSWKIYGHQNPLDDNNDPCSCGFCNFILEMAYCSDPPSWKHDDTWDAAQNAGDLANEYIYVENQGSFEIWSY